MGKISQFLEPKQLKDKRQELLTIQLQDAGKIPESVIQVNDKTCKIMGSYSSIRNLFIIPWLIGLCLTAWWNIDDFVDGWHAAEKSTIRYIQSVEKKNGKDYFKVTNDSVDLRLYNGIGPDGQMSFQEYLYHRYNNYQYSDRIFKADIIFGLFHVIAIPLLLISAVRYRRRAPLVFDRERRLIMTWRFGWTWVQRYDDLGLYENIHGLFFFLRAFRSNKKDIGYTKFVVQPSGNPIFNSSSSYQHILAFVAQFMEYGREKVLPDGPMEETKPGFYFFEDKKPEDFDEQVESILIKIDEEKQESIKVAGMVNERPM